MTDLLTPAGIERREQILQLAQRAASQRRIRRRAIGAGAAICVLALALLPLLRRHPAPPPEIARVTPRIIPERPIVFVRSPRTIEVQRIDTDPRLLDSLAIRPQPNTWRRLGDDELLRELAATGKPVALAYVNGTPVLLFDNPKR